MNKKQQYIIARDTIDMIRNYPNDVGVLEYIDGFCFSLARIFENDNVVDWDTLASICDQRYASLKSGGVGAIPLDNARLDILYAKYVNALELN